MPVTKITLSTAMRARDVSRPHAEHLAEAAEREDAVTRQSEALPPKPAGPPASATQPGPAARTPPPTTPTPTPAPPPARRRRRRRS